MTTISPKNQPPLSDAGPATTAGPRPTGAAKPPARHPDTMAEPGKGLDHG